MRIIVFLLIFFLVQMSPVNIFDVTAARFPNSVEKKIIHRGDQAHEIGLLLGLDDTHESERLYRLGKQDTWAIALREHPQDGTVVADKDRFNRVRYIPKPEPCLVMEGNWLDTQTGSSPTLPRYAFSSPPISENSADIEWGRLLRHLLPKADKLETAGGYWETVFEKRIDDKQDPIFSITIYQPKDKESAPDRQGYFIFIRSKDNNLK